MTIATVRRLAADIMGVGRNKIRISPDGLKEAEGALTRADVKALIDKGIVRKLKPSGRASTSTLERRGRGRRRGTPVSGKTVWMAKVRSQRKFLSMLVGTGAVRKEAKRELYNKVKSGIFRNKRAMLLYLKDNKFVAADYEPPKPEYRKPEPKTQNPKPETRKQEAQGQKAAQKPAVPAPKQAPAAVVSKPPAPQAGLHPKPAEKGESR